MAFRLLSRTPARLVAWGVLVSVLALLQLIFALASVSNLRATIQTIGRDATPSIEAAEQIVARLASMDASAANAALTTGAGASGAWKQFEEDRRAVNQRLVEAARNITYGDAEAKPILAMTNDLQDYLAKIERVRSLEGEAKAAELQSASSLLREKARSSAEALDAVNFAALDRAYADFQGSVWGRIAAQAAAVGLLALAFGALQVSLARRTRRLVNPPILAASAVVLFTAILVCYTDVIVARDIRTAKADAFDSIHALSKARATAYLANADESLWLLSGASARPPYERSFHANAALMAAAGGGTPLGLNANEQDDARLSENVAQQMIDARGRGYGGFLAAELSNITFSGEQRAAENMARAWLQYTSIDTKIRALENAGRHGDAIALCLGVQPGESNYAFARFDKALDATLGVNQKAFEQAVDHAFEALAPMSWTLVGGALASVALLWFGINLRLREYR